MTDISENNKRIARNTLFLYLRMFITLFVGLFTSRIVLQVLGVEDYGINAVVGGIVVLLTYLNNLLSQGTSRFLTIALGEENLNKLKNIFSSCMTLHIIVSIITLIIGETIGLWFVNNELNINPYRMYAANWVYQFSLLSCILSIIQVPYNASVISHEKMSFFAYFSIFEVIMKLLSVCLLLFVEVDKLIFIAIFTFIINLFSFGIYKYFCIKNFTECHFILRYDKKLFRSIASYTGWNSLGTFAFTINNQGINILLNIFFGTTINAARGITNSIANMITQFIYGFQTAVRPQIIKYYAQGNIEEMNKLIRNDSKFSSYLVILFGIPLFFETEYIIYLWLGQTPDYVVVFTRLTIIQILIQAIDFPIGAGIHAYGKMKLPNLTSSIVYLSILPLSFIAIKLGTTPITTYFITIIAFPIALICDLWILNKYSNFDIFDFIKEVCIKTLCIILTTSSILILLHNFMSESFYRFFLSSICSIIISSILILYCGLNKEIRYKLYNKIKQVKNINR